MHAHVKAKVAKHRNLLENRAKEFKAKYQPRLEEAKKKSQEYRGVMDTMDGGAAVSDIMKRSDIKTKPEAQREIVLARFDNKRMAARLSRAMERVDGKVNSAKEMDDALNNISRLDADARQRALGNLQSYFPEEDFSEVQQQHKTLLEEEREQERERWFPKYEKEFDPESIKHFTDKRAVIDVLEHLLEDTTHNAFHGTSSSALPGIKKKKGLVPAGELMKETMPLSGELESGIIDEKGQKGINLDAISFAQKYRDAASYADATNTIGRKHWTRAGAVKDIEAIENIQDLQFARMLGGNYSDKIGERKEVLEKYGEDSREASLYARTGGSTVKRYNIEKERLSQWPTLEEEDKPIVEGGFAVIVQPHGEGLAHEEFRRPSAISEKLYPEVPLENAAFFVPSENVEEVSEYLGSHKKVFSLNALHETMKHDEHILNNRSRMEFIKKKLEESS